MKNSTFLNLIVLALAIAVGAQGYSLYKLNQRLAQNTPYSCQTGESCCKWQSCSSQTCSPRSYSNSKSGYTSNEKFCPVDGDNYSKADFMEDHSWMYSPKSTKNHESEKTTDIPPLTDLSNTPPFNIQSDIQQTDEEFIVTLNLPKEVALEDININTGQRWLNIKVYQSKSEEGTSYSSTKTLLKLPGPVQTESLKKTFDDGKLKVTLKKA